MKRIREQLDDPNDQYETEHDLNRYYIKRVFKDQSKPRIVEENLTVQEARQRVKQDQEDNPNADYYMITYGQMQY